MELKMNAIFVLILVFGKTLIESLPLAAPDDDVIDLRPFGSALYGKPDRELTGDRVAHYSADSNDGNPEELGSYLEGDMLVPRSTKFMRSGIAGHSYRWPQGIVPYEIVGNFTDEESAMIFNTFEEYHNRTCIRFVPHVNETDYIAINNSDSGCWSSVGRIGGAQEVNLQNPSCLKKIGTVMHELMHALGFLHEQNREERDEYVVIKEANIRSSYLKNFKKANETANFGLAYDYGSIMHYSRKAFSFNGLSTMKALKKRRKGVRMGQRVDFSELDLRKMNRMYNCTAEEAAMPPPLDSKSEEMVEDTKEESIEITDASETPDNVEQSSKERSTPAYPEVLDVNNTN